MTEFQRSLVAWFGPNQRDLPWRRSGDPYPVWVSEVMLQQTTVAAVVPFFERWMARFPSIESLAHADLDDVLAGWQGLGYYRRARMLHEAAKEVVARGWPTSIEEWRGLPGVGVYTASAVGSISQGMRAAVVDGNVERVFARLCRSSAVGADLKSEAQVWADSVLLADDPGMWNQAVMELGATVCVPARPKCGQCPVSSWCEAKIHGVAGALPVPKPRTEWIEVVAHVWVPVFGERVGVRRVPSGRWWEGMWEFPREEDEHALALLLPGCEVVRLGSVRHVVTRHKIRVDVSRVVVPEAFESFEWVEPGLIGSYAMPAVNKKILAMALA